MQIYWLSSVETRHSKSHGVTRPSSVQGAKERRKQRYLTGKHL